MNSSNQPAGSDELVAFAADKPDYGATNKIQKFIADFRQSLKTANNFIILFPTFLYFVGLNVLTPVSPTVIYELIAIYRPGELIYPV